MAKQRYIKDSFWTDSYIEKLTPDEKLVFLYLLTNPLNNVAGIYEIRSKRIGFETGYDIEVIENILNRFENDKKILREGDLIVIVNHLKNQTNNPSILLGCKRVIEELSEENNRLVTGWVQAGLLNLTLLNLTLPNLSEGTSPKKREVVIKEKKRASRFVPPTVSEVNAYIKEKGYNVNAEAFVAFYESNGWKVGKNAMKSWQACLVTWNSRGNNKSDKKNIYAV